MKHEHNFAIREDRNKKMKKHTKEKKKKVIAILIIIVLVSLAIGISYSAWRYVFTGNENKITTGDVSIKFLESNTNVINLANALPEDDNTGKKEKSFDFVVTTKATYKTALKYDLSIKKLSTDTGYTSLNNNQIKVYLTDSSNNVLVEPTLISDLNNNLLYTKTNTHSSTNTEVNDKYKLRVWIDKDVDASSWTKDTKNQYKFKIGIKSEETEVAEPNTPVLDDGMIPVYYDESNSSWKKADSSNKNNNWYDYNEKKWANSVTVSSTNRGTYKSASVGTEIPMDDILTMQVWIPRYKYKVWNYNADGTKTSSPQEIEITWEEGTSKTGEITCTDSIRGQNGDGTSETCKLKSTNTACTDDTCNNKTYTHPAFTFGDEEIKGFWIGKFELTGTIINITVKPNLSSLRSQTISSFETNIIKMKNSGNQYGLSTSTDTHMIKNSEWGAVAYLSHSKYGTCADSTCKEVNINNSSDNYTGRSGGNSNSEYSLKGTYKYNETKITTTTITGGTQIAPTLTNDTRYPWTVSDGLYKSSNQGKNSTTTNLKFSFTAPTDETYLSFDWSVSSEGASNDYLYYTITKDGTTLSDTGTSTKIGGTTLGTTESALTYKNVSRKLNKGEYELTFTYTKDIFDENGTDTGYVKNIKVIHNPTVKENVIPIGEGKNGPSSSTTHNIYGVYDMSGGAAEYMMSNNVDNGTSMLPDSSGYTFTTYPDAKYYDKYSYSASETSRKKSKLGDGIKEVYNTSNYGWYNDNSYLVYSSSSSSWFLRGGCYYDGSYAGVFSSYYDGGDSNSYYSSRLIITP